MNKQTTIILPIETKRQVRVLAAELNMPMGKTALELIKIGLTEYKKNISNPLYADKNSTPMELTEGVPA
jgi:hypothetical protein